MKLIKSCKIEDFVHCLADDVAIYILNNNKSYVKLTIFDYDSFERSAEIDLNLHINELSKPSIDNECIHVADIYGQIVSYDKFTGDILNKIDLGMMPIVSDLIQKQDNFYFIGALPIRTKIKIESDIFCVCMASKFKPRKQVQSQSMKGDFFGFSMEDDIIIIGIGNSIYKNIAFGGYSLG